MRFKLTATRNTEKNLIKIHNFPKNSIDAIMDELEITGQDIRNEVIRSVGASPQSSKGVRKGGKIHYPSLPGNPPRTDEGNMIRQYRVRTVRSKLQLFVEVGNRLRAPPYPLFLEEGTARIKARPALLPATEKELMGLEDRVLRAIQSVK